MIFRFYKDSVWVNCACKAVGTPDQPYLFASKWGDISNFTPKIHFCYFMKQECLLNVQRMPFLFFYGILISMKLNLHLDLKWLSVWVKSCTFVNKIELKIKWFCLNLSYYVRVSVQCFLALVQCITRLDLQCISCHLPGKSQTIIIIYWCVLSFLIRQLWGKWGANLPTN